MIDPADLIRRKRDGQSLEPGELFQFIQGSLTGSVREGQTGALLMAILFRGLDDDELAALTEAMVASGDRFRFEGAAPLVDKHSTGGVGDKLSFTLAPALAAAGLRVPMISGRALGHTGGTLCKLEAIPGFKVEQDLTVLQGLLDEVGCFIIEQGPTLVPGDRLLYGLRNATATVESVPLIVSSILSKKVAEGLDALVLDLKTGTGSSFQDENGALELARRLVGLANRLGLKTRGVRTAMDQPLGVAVGNALEVREALATLQGEGPPDLQELTLHFGALLLAETGACPSIAAGRARIAEVLSSGAAAERFQKMVAAQGGDLRALPRSTAQQDWRAPGSGRLGVLDCRFLSHAARALGGLRDGQGNPPDPAVGLEWLVRAGEVVQAGDPLVRLHHKDAFGLEEARAWLSKAVTFDGGQEPLPLVLGEVLP